MTPQRIRESKHQTPKQGKHRTEIEVPSKEHGSESYCVLIVDDDAALLEISAELLSAYGFEVITATSGEAALEILHQQNNIDVLLSDIVMPGMSGLQLGYKARERHPHIKIILASGYPNPALDSGHGYLSDFDFLRKPYRVHEVLKLLDPLS